MTRWIQLAALGAAMAVIAGPVAAQHGGHWGGGGGHWGGGGGHWGGGGGHWGHGWGGHWGHGWGGHGWYGGWGGYGWYGGWPVAYGPPVVLAFNYAPPAYDYPSGYAYSDYGYSAPVQHWRPATVHHVAHHATHHRRRAHCACATR